MHITSDWHIHTRHSSCGSPEATVELVDKTGEVEFRLVEGSNDRIQLESLLARFALVGRSMEK